MIQASSDIPILITGANGKLGQFLRRAWSRHPPVGHRLLYLARSTPADVIWSPDNPQSGLPACGTIIAAWGRTSGDGDDLAQNTTLARHALHLARACGARRVLHFSSAAVYGPGQNLSESAITAPSNPYGHAKLATENTVKTLPSEGIHHCCLRLANVVGADSLATALRPSGRPVCLDRFADGQGPLRSYIAPTDLAKVLIGLANLPPENLPDILNVAAPQPVSMESLARAADRDIQWQMAPETARQTVTLDCTRLVRLLPGALGLTTARGMISDWQQLEALS